MAAAKSSVCGNASRSKALLLFLGFIFIVLVLLARPTNQSRISMASTLPTERILSDSHTTSQSTMKFHPQQAKTTRTSSPSTSTHRQFGAGAHEVPSGPNPISNK